MSTGHEKFNAYFFDMYRDRWQSLLASLQPSSTNNKTNINILDISTLASVDPSHNQVMGECRSELPPENSTSLPASNSATPAYYIDLASYFSSVIAYQIIKAQHASDILDMCSAPGGKLLALLHLLHANAHPHALSITANEKSTPRLHRLKRNLQDYYFCFAHAQRDTAHKHHIQCACRDANLYGKHNKAQYDFIVLDAPCSNERHVLNNEKELAIWSPSRCVRLAHAQLSLLCAAVDACKIGGHILYMTCSLSPAENEQVIARLMTKRNVAIVEPPAPQLPSDRTNSLISHTLIQKLLLEQRPHGTIILPDTSQLAGPLYLCLIQKLSLPTVSTKPPV